MHSSIRHRLFYLVICSCAFTSGAADVAETLPSGLGLAARYPGDVDIEKDIRVIQVEKFEQADIATLAKQWESVGAKDSMSFAADVPPGSAGLVTTACSPVTT